MPRSKIIWQHRAGIYKWTTDKNKLPPVQIENLKWRAQSRTIREEMISCISYYEQCWLYLGKTFSISAATRPQIYTSRQFVASACSWVGRLLVLLVGAGVPVRSQSLILQRVSWHGGRARERLTEAGPKLWLGRVRHPCSCSGLKLCCEGWGSC